ncbi:hypothetical protein EW146_g2826 [Bondarzewia mesenterica]|uniref:Choline kinase N-terminal domain-containing protein n=1 Tax=Bondarzewia mesenterica TaxID=1095465 RepID=A0A4S4M1C4_9AGAM|nr:hypothetical protein EW146_g2826 [Bondarzewia mesenterica]
MRPTVTSRTSSTTTDAQKSTEPSPETVNGGRQLIRMATAPRLIVVTRPYRWSQFCSSLSFSHHLLAARLQSTMSPNVVGPEYSPTTPISIPRSLNRSSTNSRQSLAASTTPSSTLSSFSSTGASHLDERFAGDGLLEGVRHAQGRLDARQYKSPVFAQQLLDIFNALLVPSWSKSAITPNALHIDKVSGSLTNAVFFVSSPLTSTRTLLLRIYGPSSGSLISRPRELHTLHVLSSSYHMGPRIYGTFDNGRVEEYFDSVTLSASDIRDDKISAYIGSRMAELHGVDIAAIEKNTAPSQGTGTPWQIGAKKNVQSWLPPARDVLAIPAIPNSVRKELDLDVFQTKWEKYMAWLDEFERREGSSKRVFCHNDAQYGNLLQLNKLKEGTPDHHQIIVVDFEYASPNPAAFDIANHFHEWTANYHTSVPHVLDPTHYPTLAQRINFYTAYLSHCQPPLPSSSTSLFLTLSQEARQRELDTLERQVHAWSPASHAVWAVWGLVQAREDIEGNVSEPEFDYVGYARCRMAGFYEELQSLGI